MTDTSTAKAQLQTALGAATNQVNALNVAISLIDHGYQSDQDAISAGIEAGVAAQLAQEVAEATASLTSQITAKDARIAELEAELAASQG